MVFLVFAFQTELAVLREENNSNEYSFILSCDKGILVDYEIISGAPAKAQTCKFQTQFSSLRMNNNFQISRRVCPEQSHIPFAVGFLSNLFENNVSFTASARSIHN